jgi:hypothetical protein
VVSRQAGQYPAIQNIWLQNPPFFETIHGTTESPLPTLACLRFAFWRIEVPSVRSATRGFRFRTEGVRR